MADQIVTELVDRLAHGATGSSARRRLTQALGDIPGMAASRALAALAQDEDRAVALTATYLLELRKDGTVTWTSPAPAPADGPMTGGDRAILEGYLAGQRSTLLNVCAGLTAEQLAARPVPPSTLSLLGLVRHLTKVERIWLRQRVAGQDVPPLHGGPGDDTDFLAADPSRAEQELQALREEWQLADEAVVAVPFDHEIDLRGEAMSLRMVYVHLIGEYARHNGHADLLREALDGVTGR